MNHSRSLKFPRGHKERSSNRYHLQHLYNNLFLVSNHRIQRNHRVFRSKANNALHVTKIMCYAKEQRDKYTVEESRKIASRSESCMYSLLMEIGICFLCQNEEIFSRTGNNLPCAERVVRVSV